MVKLADGEWMVVVMASWRETRKLVINRHQVSVNQDEGGPEICQALWNQGLIPYCTFKPLLIWEIHVRYSYHGMVKKIYVLHT